MQGRHLEKPLVSVVLFFHFCLPTWSDMREPFIASEVWNHLTIWLVIFNSSSKHRLVVSGTCGHLLKLLEATLCGDKKKKGPIKPSHHRQILLVQQSLLITVNSWRSFQRGLDQGQERLDLNYPWHNVWPFCYHWGGQHLLRRHGSRGQQGYSGQQHSPSQPPSQLLPCYIEGSLCNSDGWWSQEGICLLKLNGVKRWGLGTSVGCCLQLGWTVYCRAEPWRADTCSERGQLQPKG